jgi:hypothetical protein
MSYVERVLQPGEQVRHISSIHWIVYWPGVADVRVVCKLISGARDAISQLERARDGP